MWSSHNSYQLNWSIGASWHRSFVVIFTCIISRIVLLFPRTGLIVIIASPSHRTPSSLFTVPLIHCPLHNPPSFVPDSPMRTPIWIFPPMQCRVAKSRMRLWSVFAHHPIGSDTIRLLWWGSFGYRQRGIGLNVGVECRQQCLCCCWCWGDDLSEM
jgi:hypothetical protein